jgi:hypothetical protein
VAMQEQMGQTLKPHADMATNAEQCAVDRA